MLASKLSTVLQSKSHKARYLVKDWASTKEDRQCYGEVKGKPEQDSTGSVMEGRECREGLKAFCAPTWELPTEAVCPHLMFLQSKSTHFTTNV